MWFYVKMYEIGVYQNAQVFILKWEFIMTTGFLSYF